MPLVFRAREAGRTNSPTKNNEYTRMEQNLMKLDMLLPGIVPGDLRVLHGL